jgi:hypothetical protein
MRLLSVGAVLLVMFACRSTARSPLANTFTSPEALAVEVLQALTADNRPRLRALALSEQEFRDHVWPDLPAARPERNLPFSYVWGSLHEKSEIGLAATLARHRGRRYALQRVAFAAETPYAHYRVHRQATFHARDGSGKEYALRVCGSIVEKDGRWKVFSYVVDE